MTKIPMETRQKEPHASDFNIWSCRNFDGKIDGCNESGMEAKEQGKAREDRGEQQM